MVINAVKAFAEYEKPSLLLVSQLLFLLNHLHQLMQAFILHKGKVMKKYSKGSKNQHSNDIWP